MARWASRSDSYLMAGPPGKGLSGVGTRGPGLRRDPVGAEFAADRLLQLRSPEFALEGDQQALDAAWPHPSLHVGCGDGLQSPTLPSVLVQQLLQLGAAHLAAEH